MQWLNLPTRVSFWSPTPSHPPTLPLSPSPSLFLSLSLSLTSLTTNLTILVLGVGERQVLACSPSIVRANVLEWY